MGRRECIFPVFFFGFYRVVLFLFNSGIEESVEESV